MPSTIDVTDVSFQHDVLESDVPVIVDFWAEWCQPCKRMTPILDEVADALGDGVRVAKLDTDSNPATTMAYRITGIPAFKVFRAGEEVGEIVGSRQKAAFEAELRAILG